MIRGRRDRPRFQDFFRNFRSTPMPFRINLFGRTRLEAANEPARKRQEPFNLTLAVITAAKHDFNHLKVMIERSADSEENIEKMRTLITMLEETTDPETVRGANSVFREVFEGRAA
jgi:hypothetical protein